MLELRCQCENRAHMGCCSSENYENRNWCVESEIDTCTEIVIQSELGDSDSVLFELINQLSERSKRSW